MENYNISTLKSCIISLFYPVGSIFMSTNSTSPEEIFGGTWEKINGKFLFAEDSTHLAGTTGGESSHTLTLSELPLHSHAYNKSNNITEGTAITVSQLPSHNHRVWSTNTWSENAVGLSHDRKAFGIAGIDQGGGSEGWTNTETGDGHQIVENTGSGQAHKHSISFVNTNTASIGNGSSHNNMPPYLAVYMWKRIS